MRPTYPSAVELRPSKAPLPLQIGPTLLLKTPLILCAALIIGTAGSAFAVNPTPSPTPSEPPTPTITAKSGGAQIPFVDGDFEDTSIPTWTNRSSFGNWTMVGQVVIAKNGSGFTTTNTPAPRGVYCVVLQGSTTMKQNYNFTPGTWRIRFHAAPRNRGATVVDRPALRITVGGTTVQELRVEDFRRTSYYEYTTRPFTITGSTTGTTPTEVAFIGLVIEDHSVLIDNIRLEPVPVWNSADTWDKVRVPNQGDHVSIPAGVEVAMSGVCQAATIDVSGELLAAPANTTLSSRWVLIHGQESVLQVGTPGAPFLQNFTLTLTGNEISENVLGAGSKFLMAKNEGWIEMHGRPQVSWTKLNATANAGSFSITLKDAVGWQSGDQIVIASSTFNANEAEVRTIDSVSSDGKTLTLKSALSHRHYGVAKTYTRNRPGTPVRTWTLDQRAEVGLLTRNVKVQGDEQSETTKFGGHIMIMKCAACVYDPGYAEISNVELFRMGQKKLLGRYPMHWHMLGDRGRGQYLRNSSIHRSYNRAITIHGSQLVRVEGNVAFDHVGHGIFLEDGSEHSNQINYNLVLGTIKPSPADALLPTDHEHAEFQNRSPASFWITNPNNTMIGNVAAGTVDGSLAGATCGTGFWFALPANVLGLSSLDARFAGIRPNKEALGRFEGNVAHSNRTGMDTNDGIDTNDRLQSNLGWDPPNPAALNPPLVADLRDFTAYANTIAIYAGIGSDKIFYSGAVLADNSFHLFLAAYQTVKDSLLVADGGGDLLPAWSGRDPTPENWTVLNESSAG